MNLFQIQLSQLDIRMALLLALIERAEQTDEGFP